MGRIPEKKKNSKEMNYYKSETLNVKDEENI